MDDFAGAIIALVSSVASCIVIACVFMVALVRRHNHMMMLEELRNVQRGGLTQATGRSKGRTFTCQLEEFAMKDRNV